MNKASIGALESGLAGKSNTNHDHNSLYYTQTEIDSKLSTKSDNTHNHDSVYMKKGETPSLDGYITKTELRNCNHYKLIEVILDKNNDFVLDTSKTQIDFDMNNYYEKIQSYYYGTKSNTYNNGYIQIYIIANLQYKDSIGTRGWVKPYCVYNSIIHFGWDQFGNIHHDFSNSTTGGLGNNIVLYDSKIFSCVVNKLNITIKPIISISSSHPKSSFAIYESCIQLRIPMIVPYI